MIEIEIRVATIVDSFCNELKTLDCRRISLEAGKCRRQKSTRNRPSLPQHPTSRDCSAPTASCPSLSKQIALGSVLKISRRDLSYLSHKEHPQLNIGGSL
jgi:hypothetical protein